MSTTPDKDFGPIAEDYVFFEAHSTEAEADLLAYQPHFAAIASGETPIRFLDFGGGTGSFTERLLARASWSPSRLQLTLVEPVDASRKQATSRLTSFTDYPITDSATLPTGPLVGFDFVLANHVFYYVGDLNGHLTKIIDALSPAGLFLTAIASRTNAMYPIWVEGFRAINRDIPYHTSEDVETALEALGANYQKEQVAYEMAFPDTEENRMKILRFLLADHLAEMPIRRLVDCFDRYANDGQVLMRTGCEHFIIRPGRRGS